MSKVKISVLDDKDNAPRLVRDMVAKVEEDFMENFVNTTRLWSPILVENGMHPLQAYAAYNCAVFNQMMRSIIALFGENVPPNTNQLGAEIFTNIELALKKAREENPHVKKVLQEMEL